MTMTAPRTAPKPDAGLPLITTADPSVTFPEGLVGCPTWKRFVLIVEDAEELPVAMLQSLDDPDCTMLVADPKMVEPSYTVRLTAEDRAALALGADGQPVLYCTLSVSADGWISANLLAPLAINPVTRKGLQLVLDESSYTTTHTIAQVSTEAD
jgi:flagellar assembly factor FliW